MNNLLFNIAGHSIYSKGARAYNGRWEHDYTSELQALVSKYAKELVSGADGVLRPRWVVIEDCETLSLSNVISAIGNKGRGIDIHFNDNNRNASGTEVFVHPATTKENKLLATNIARGISRELGVRHRKSGRRAYKYPEESFLGRLAILEDTAIPMVLIEVCFLNSHDLPIYEAKKDRVARVIVEQLNKLL